MLAEIAVRQRLRRPLHLIGSEQGPALGSAIHAAVAAGLYADIHAASAAMGSQIRDAYLPDEENADAYDELYAHYVRAISPDAFTPLFGTFLIWVMLMLGGSGNNKGAILGAFLVWGIWTGTTFISDQASPPFGAARA